ncbi:MAG TPA: hypothetical protein VJ436_11185, partial [Anaerolineales bacterium]|nr:hypothetical protein [Anaerolineales bacterium]
HPPILVGDFTSARATLALQTRKGLVSVQLSGLASQLLFTNQTGRAADLDNDGLDQVQTEMFQLNLTGESSLGPVTLRLRDPARSPYLFSVGALEEAQDRKTGRLDLPPFTASGSGMSIFDMLFEIEIAGQVYTTAAALQLLHNEQPLTLQAEVSSSTPGEGDVFISQGSVELFDDSNNLSELSIPSLRIVPDPLAPGKVNYLPLILGKSAAKTVGITSSLGDFTGGQSLPSAGGATSVALSIVALFFLGRARRRLQ